MWSPYPTMFYVTKHVGLVTLEYQRNTKALLYYPLQSRPTTLTKTVKVDSHKLLLMRAAGVEVCRAEK